MDEGQKVRRTIRLAALGLALLALLLLLHHHWVGPVPAVPTATATAAWTKTPTRTIAPTATGTPTATPPAGAAEAIRKVSPVVFVMWDADNLDYAALHPDWPALGGLLSFAWDDLYPGDADVPDWSVIDRYILQAQQYTVTLHDGRVIAKPVAFGLDVATMHNLGTLRFPSFVLRQCGPASRLTYTYDPDGESGPCLAYSIPNYANTCWQQHFWETVRLMGQHYDNNPAFDNLEWVKMNLGWDEEAVPWKVMGRNEDQVCDYTSGPAAGFDAWVHNTILAYNAAFPHLVNVAQMMLHATQPMGDWLATFPQRSTGIKLNGWVYDVEGARIHYGLASPQLVGGVFGYGERWHGVLPVGYEPAGTWTGGYWEWLNLLIAHPDLLDMQYDLLQRTAALQEEIGFPILEWGLAHLGKTAEDAPDVWIAFRETRQQAERWCAAPLADYPADCTRYYGGTPVPNGGTYKAYDPVFGPFEFWLREVRERAYGSYTYRTADAAQVLAELPAPAEGHPYAANSVVRTDQAAAQPYVLLDIADEYAPASSHLPLSAGGDTVWVITATVVNVGADRLALQYLDHSGNLVQRIVQKGAHLGPVNQWVDVAWTLPDAYMAGGLAGDADFRLDCLADGDEYVTRVIVTHYHPHTPAVLAGLATHYDPAQHAGRETRSGERYDAEAMACAVPAERWAQLAGKRLLVCVARARALAAGCVTLRVNDSGFLTEVGRFAWGERAATDGLRVAQYWPDPQGQPVVLDLPPGAFRLLSPDMETVEVQAYVLE